ncbi:ALG-2 interacting protein X-like [Schistocerca gregaria]|uniref:ALG-2 interacting protein X-like n=1 Tax=Schistocerca gregaria TaxID=7010 RepID=UPI00211EEFAE|nr:ALG-2 interacting protein X-like [Schistocerca gregaria]
MGCQQEMGEEALGRLSYQVSCYMCSAVLVGRELGEEGHTCRLVSYAKCKAELYRAISLRHAASVHEAAREYGAAVSRLRSAARTLEALKKDRAYKQVPELEEFYEFVYESVRRDREERESDNETIYHETVPEERLLPSLVGREMVKACRMDSSVWRLEVDPFRELVPLSVKRRESVYTEMRDERYREVLRESEEWEERLRCALEEFRFAEDLDGRGRIASELGEESRRLECLSRECSHLLAEVHEALRTCDEREEVGRALVAALREEEQKCSENMACAQRSDLYIKEKLSAYLMMQESQGGSASSAGEKEDPNILSSEIRHALSKVGVLLHVRSTALAEFKRATQEDTITQQLLGSNSKNDPQLFESQLKKFDVYVEKVRNCNEQQIALFDRLVSLKDQYVRSKKDDDYLKLKASLKEGIHFYTKFRQNLTELREKCNELIIYRRSGLGSPPPYTRKS